MVGDEDESLVLRRFCKQKEDNVPAAEPRPASNQESAEEKIMGH
ncbi:hypothetical protein [Salibacterium halotolerans]|uniref:Uncharacterized protein n=1 Tax=Salibacterium halotolerans TaxID=1884432 RepID=A0A1I5M0G6_9BACI|nr:hypothetical protein [Salibacterium halotolerans]SFP03084.1 hypothetical protein SAMN05518683_10245 [Salibacterium halotolerans]